MLNYGKIVKDKKNKWQQCFIAYEINNYILKRKYVIESHNLTDIYKCKCKTIFFTEQ